MSIDIVAHELKEAIQKHSERLFRERKALATHLGEVTDCQRFISNGEPYIVALADHLLGLCSDSEVVTLDEFSFNQLSIAHATGLYSLNIDRFTAAKHWDTNALLRPAN